MEDTAKVLIATLVATSAMIPVSFAASFEVKEYPARDKCYQVEQVLRPSPLTFGGGVMIRALPILSAANFLATPPLPETLTLSYRIRTNRGPEAGFPATGRTKRPPAPEHFALAAPAASNASTIPSRRAEKTRWPRPRRRRARRPGAGRGGGASAAPIAAGSKVRARYEIGRRSPCPENEALFRSRRSANGDSVEKSAGERFPLNSTVHGEIGFLSPALLSQVVLTAAAVGGISFQRSASVARQVGLFQHYRPEANAREVDAEARCPTARP